MHLFSAVRVPFSNVKNLYIPLCGYVVTAALNLSNGTALKPYLKCFSPKCVRKISLCHPLSCENSEGEEKGKKQGKDKSKRLAGKGVKVCVIKEYGGETYMYLVEAEKYAKRNNLTLIKLDSSTKEKPKYKLQSVSDIDDTEEKSQKNNSKNIKQIFLREDISQNDILIKTKQMLKFLQKQISVTCVVQSRDSNKLKKLCDDLNASELQQYLVQEIQLQKGKKLLYEAKGTKAEGKSEKIKPRKKESADVS